MYNGLLLGSGARKNHDDVCSEAYLFFMFQNLYTFTAGDGMCNLVFPQRNGTQQFMVYTEIVPCFPYSGFGKAECRHFSRYSWYFFVVIVYLSRFSVV